jgi:hypothetical protein
MTERKKYFVLRVFVSKCPCHQAQVEQHRFEQNNFQVSRVAVKNEE